METQSPNKRPVEFFKEKIMLSCSARQLLSRLLILLSLVLSLDASPVSAADGTNGSPRLAVPNPVYDFGSVAQGTKVEHDFELKNVGNSPLVIKRVLPSCGCTAAILAKSTLQPGESTQIKGVFNTDGFSGIQEKTVRVFTNDSKQATSVLSLRGTVKRDVSVDPPRIFFPEVKKGTSASAAVVVLGEPNSGVTIRDVSSRSDLIELDVSDTQTKTQTGKRIIVKTKPSLPVGMFQAMVSVKTSSQKNPVVNIPVSARVVGDLRFEPTDISLGLVEGPLTKPITQSVTLINSGADPVRVLSVESTNPAVSVSSKVLEPGKRFEISVTVPEGFADTLKAQVKVTTDHSDPDQKEIPLPLYGIITKKGA